jgi:hypothetical protein
VAASAGYIGAIQAARRANDPTQDDLIARGWAKPGAGSNPTGADLTTLSPHDQALLSGERPPPNVQVPGTPAGQGLSHSTPTNAPYNLVSEEKFANRPTTQPVFGKPPEKAPEAYPSAPMPGGGGGGGGAAAGAAGPRRGVEQPSASPARQALLQQAFEHEQEAKGIEGETEARSHEDNAQQMREAIGGVQAGQPGMEEDQAARHALIGRLLQDAQNTARDVASQRIDLQRFFKNLSTGDRIRYAIAAGLGGFAGSNTVANMIQSMVNADNEAQRSSIEQGNKSFEDKMSVMHAALKATGDMDVAALQDQATKLNYAKLQVQAAAEESQAPIVRARAAGVIAELERKAAEVGIALNGLVYPKGGAGGGAAPGGPGGGVLLDVDADEMFPISKDDKGQQLYLHVGKGQSTDLVRSQAAGKGVERDADQLQGILDSQGGIDSYEKYRQALALALSIASSEPLTKGKGSGRSLGLLQSYMGKMGLPAGGKGDVGPTDFWKFHLANKIGVPLERGMSAAITTLKKDVQDDAQEALTQASKGHVGYIVPGPAQKDGTRKLKLYATGQYEPPQRKSATAPPLPKALPLPAATK